jgi:hypothetical protein
MDLVLAEKLRGLIANVRRMREQYRERGLGEENTKASLIEPILEALGWAIRDPDEVHREFRHNPRDNPVDYCLRLQRDTRLLIETKGLGRDMQDRRWINQTLGYAAVAGAKWCVLTDGDEYLVYNATEAVDADRKLFCRIKLSEARDDEAINVLALISRNNVEKDVLSSLWKSHFVDSQVRSTLRNLIDTPDRGLVRLIQKSIPGLSGKEIAASFRRLEIRIDVVQSPYESGKPPSDPEPTGGKKATPGDAALSDLIAAQVLAAPLKLFRKYKGHDLTADLGPDGQVVFQGISYGSCSQAGEVARSKILGRKVNTNGWTFWQYRTPDGKTRNLADARRQLAKSGGKPGGGKTPNENPERHALRKKFWGTLVSRPKAMDTRHANIAASKYSWISASSGVNGVAYLYSIGQNKGRVEVYIYRGPGSNEENKQMFDLIQKHKKEIEQAFGAELSWQRLDDKQACRIFFPTVGGWRSDESKWSEIQDAMIEAMMRLEKAIAPALESLKTELG